MANLALCTAASALVENRGNALTRQLQRGQYPEEQARGDVHGPGEHEHGAEVEVTRGGHADDQREKRAEITERSRQLRPAETETSRRMFRVSQFAFALPVRYGSQAMAQGKVTDAASLLAELREQVHVLDERVTELGRHL